ncbi:MAG: 5-oxoprolinase subunit PxpA [Pseudohongiella sp.]|nr:5-oxoprolinase subunit PxpA [Pseudohongiella sp.]MDP2126952.1 5-oxoprolinase subunit PxpA [Pseudohongiella sp.]
MTRGIDLNADLGEGGKFDRELLTLVSSASISCGAHAGSGQDIWQAIAWAVENNVAIGAHPSYPDRENRGRLSIAIEPAELYKTLMQQLNWLATLVAEQGGRLQHVKPHGALYNDAARDNQLAVLIAQCVRDFDPSLTLVGLAGGKLLEAGQSAGLEVRAEAFIDRRYQADGSLVPRKHERALITDVAEALAQARCFITGDPVTTVDGNSINVKADTLCIHGDSEYALEFAQHLCSGLLLKGIVVRALS